MKTYLTNAGCVLFTLALVGLVGRCNGQTTVADLSDTSHIKMYRDSANSYQRRMQIDSALHFHKKALQKSKQLGMAEHQARSLVHIARLLKDSDVEGSIGHLRNALMIADRLNHQELKADIYYAMSGIYKQSQNYHEALVALEEHQKLLTATFQRNENNHIAHIQSIENAKRERLILYSTIALVFLGACALCWFYIRTKKWNRLLQDNNKVKDKLFSIIGHDLRGPSGSIMAGLELLDTEVLDKKEQKEFICMLKDQSRSFNETLNTLFSWASTQLQGILPNRVAVNILPVIERNVEVMKSQILQKKLKINIPVLDMDIKVYADVNHVDFVIRNLLSNAIKFSHESGIILITISEDEQEVIVSVKDQGVGISHEKQNLLLSSNGYMESSFGTMGEKGTGLGLALAKEFIYGNSGRLSVKSQKDKGTTFYVHFPKASR